MVAICLLTVGVWAAEFPSLELRALAKQVALPAGAAEQWDAIGTYTIKGTNAATTVKLYYADSDSIAEKERQRSGLQLMSYPNDFSIHAVYREADGAWKYKRLYGVARVGFWKVAEIKAESVTIQVRSKLIIFSNSSIRFSDDDLKRIYEPVSKKLSVKDGVPSLD